MNPQQAQAMQQQFQHYAVQYPVNLKFPSNITAPKGANAKPLRTNTDLIQVRLIEAGVVYETPQSVSHSAEALNKFVVDLQKTGCFQSVQVEIDQPSDAEDSDSGQPVVSAISGEPLEAPPTQQLNVILTEKNWYRLYVGGGLRNDLQPELADSGNLLSKTQFETSAGLCNLTGNLDNTSINYTIDATSNARWSFQHVRPLDVTLPDAARLFFPNVGKYSLGVNAILDTLDYEWTRSYKERQRLVSIRASNQGQISNPEMAPSEYIGWEWAWLFRDIVPRRHPTLPYALDASPEICAQSGPSEKHSLVFEYRTNGTFCDDKFNPAVGLDYYSKVELAGPPGEVGFVKVQSGLTHHLPAIDNNSLLCSFHTSLHTGILRSLSFGGLCQPAAIPDRFFAGGPMQLRGFCPAGIGPRAKSGSQTAPQGDAIGGDFFYTATAALSFTTPYLEQHGFRFLAFGNAGTLAGSVASIPLSSLARSTRVSVGLGASVGTPMGRVETTYAWPVRYGPRDVRKNLQFGIGFSFG